MTLGRFIMRELTPTRNTIASRIGGKNMLRIGLLVACHTCCQSELSVMTECVRACLSRPRGLLIANAFHQRIGSSHRVKDNDAHSNSAPVHSKRHARSTMERVMRDAFDMQLLRETLAAISHRALWSGFEVL